MQHRQLALKRRRRVLIAIVALTALAALPLLLPMLAWPLQSAETSGPAGFYCLHGCKWEIEGFRSLDCAAEWRRATGGTILLILPRTTRIVKIGAVPSFEQTCRRELTKRGVPADGVQPLETEADNTWEQARALAAWLQQHPQATVALACKPFSGGKLRYVLDRVLGPDDRLRVRLVSLADPDYPPAWWWLSRTGVKDFMYGWLELLYARRDDSDIPVAEASAVEFWHAVETQIGEAPQ